MKSAVHEQLSAHCATTQAFVKQVKEFSRALDVRRAATAHYLAMVAKPQPHAPPELGGAVALIEEQHEELAVAREEMAAQIEALEDVTTAADRERRRYRELFETTPFALLVVDRAGLVRATNRAAAELFEAETAALRGRALAAFVPPSEAGAFRALLDAGQGSHSLSLARPRGAPFRAHVSCSPIEDGNRLLVAVERLEPDIDYTRETVQLARALRDKEDLLERERSLRSALERTDSAKDRFIAILSHDLRGPINAALGWTRMLRNEQLPKDTRMRAFETIERNMRTQLSLVEELLDMSRIANDKIRLDLRALDLRACARQIVESMAPLAFDGGVRVVAELDDDPTPVFADRVRIVQILSNLLSNAIKFTPGGGNVRVCVRRETPYALLDVQDDGRGIDGAALPHVFDCYRQGEDAATSRSGLGLGLYIVRRLVELHGGVVEAASDGRGKGSRFTVRIPLADEKTEPASVRAVERNESNVDLEPLRVLVVDDDPDARDLLAMVFSEKGATVLAADDAAHALAMFESCSPDVVVTDLDMPGEDGFALLRRIRALAPDVPMIAVSGFASRRDAERAYAAGFDVHLAKPFDACELLDRVRELSRRSDASRDAG